LPHGKRWARPYRRLEFASTSLQSFERLLQLGFGRRLDANLDRSSQLDSAPRRDD